MKSIRVNKDKDGLHHRIPIGRVARLDERVHLDRSVEQAMPEWSSTVPSPGGSSLSRCATRAR